MNGNFLEYLQEMFYDGISRIFPVHGLFTYPYVLTNNGDGTFTIGTDPLIGTDGEGHILKLTGTDRNTNIPFEDTAATYYWVGMHYIEVPSGVYTNPRTGQVEYDLILEEIGELDNPSSVTDAGAGTIKLVVDSIFENGVDYSGRLVTVWLTNPMSADAAVAFETLTVSYDGGSGENSVTTTTLLGQASVSVATADYQVAALGVTVKKSATNPWVGSPYTIIGYVEGSTTNETTTDSRDLSGGGGHTLQKAYDGAGGAGDGRNISTTNEAVELDQLNLTLASQDVFHAPLRLTKDGERSVISNPTWPHDVKDTEGGIDILQRMLALYALMCRVNLVDSSGNDFLRGSEAIDTISPTTIGFPRVGVDLFFTGLDAEISPYLDLVQIVDSSNGNDGIYIVASLTPITITLKNLDGTDPTFVAETSTSMEARIYRAILRVNTYDSRSGENDQSSLLLTNHDGFTFDYGGQYQIPLKIVGSLGSLNDSPLILVQDYSGGLVFQTRYDGKTDLGGLLDTNGWDIDTEGGDVLSGGGIIDSESGIIRSGGGVIDSEGGDIQASGGDITTTSFGIISSNHNIIADNDGNGIGDFKYGAARSIQRSVNIEHGIDISGGGWTYTTAAVSGQGYWEHLGPASNMYFPFMIPAGAVLDDVEVLVNKINTNQMNIRVWRNNVNWSTPGVPSPVNLGSNGTTGTGPLIMNVLGIGHTSLSDEDRYYIEIDVLAGTQADKIYAIRITFDYDTIVPSVSP